MTKSATLRAKSNEPDERRSRLRRGTLAERIAALWLMLKGYRILARRHRTPHGEVDIIAVRRRRLAFVEVKRRETIEEAWAALSPAQCLRIGNAADYWIARRPRFREYDVGLDAILIVPRCWPTYVPNALTSL
jgi:putative endonuclease